MKVAFPPQEAARTQLKESPNFPAPVGSIGECLLVDRTSGGAQVSRLGGAQIGEDIIQTQQQDVADGSKSS